MTKDELAEMLEVMSGCGFNEYSEMAEDIERAFAPQGEQLKEAHDSEIRLTAQVAEWQKKAELYNQARQRWQDAYHHLDADIAVENKNLQARIDDLESKLHTVNKRAALLEQDAEAQRDNAQHLKELWGEAEAGWREARERLLTLKEDNQALMDENHEQDKAYIALHNNATRLLSERDEAREWARKLYQLLRGRLQ